MQHIINCLVDNKAGVLASIAGLFSSRNFNIESLAVGETDDPRYSRMTIAARGDDAVVEQIEKQLNRLVHVIKVTDVTAVGHVERDLMLIKVNCQPAQRAEIWTTVQMFKGTIVDISTRDLTIELCGPEQKVTAFIQNMRPYGIRELVRSGRIAMVRTSETETEPERRKAAGRRKMPV